MKKIGLLPRIIIGIILGILVGMFLPAPVVRIFVTISSIFSLFLNFIIPLMIVAFIGYGIANLTEGATKLIGITVAISYGSTLLAGSIAFLVASNLFPTLLGAAALSSVKIESGLDSYFTIPLKPLFDVTSAVVFAFILGIGITMLRPKKQGEELFSIVRDSEEVIQAILKNIIIPILPLHILGTFANLAYAGSIQHILIIFGKVFAVVITLHILYITALFIISGVIAKKSPLMLIKNQIPPYFTAVGTQSSAATTSLCYYTLSRFYDYINLLFYCCYINFRTKSYLQLNTSFHTYVGNSYGCCSWCSWRCCYECFTFLLYDWNNWRGITRFDDSIIFDSRLIWYCC